MSAAQPSTVPAVIAYLQTAIAAQVATDTNPGDIYLCIGDPGTPDPAGIIQIVSEVTRTPEHFALVHDGSFGAVYEKYTIQVKIDVAMKGDTEADIALAVVQRAWQLLNYVEQAVRADPSLGGLVVEGWPGPTTGGQATWSGTGAMVCGLTYRIACEMEI